MKKLVVLILLFVSASASLYLISCSGNNKTEKETTDKISYNFQVRPIFSDKCFKCHGPDANKREAGLRLDIEEEAYKSLRDHPRAHAIVPGKPDFSELYLRISTDDTALQMPPPASNLPALTGPEQAVIKKWIAQGANYEPHWAFIAPKKANLPVVKDKTWAKNEIDYFILQQLENNNLSPNDEADK
ncbi:MAG: c-type cytochrome domain-containing protein [Chitinophagaceae bacterium]